jgi:hypothetical protein
MNCPNEAAALELAHARQAQIRITFPLADRDFILFSIGMSPRVSFLINKLHWIVRSRQVWIETSRRKLVPV